MKTPASINAMRHLLLVAVVLMIVETCGCSTSSGVLTNPSIPKTHYATVYLVLHGGNGSDMDANFQKEFLRHGLSVTVGPEGGGAGAQLIARYADDWKWDMAMYLHRLDLMLFDGKTNTLIATGSWKNSKMHGFYGSEKVVTDVVNDTFSKISAP
jgi:hypothetical protein